MNFKTYPDADMLAMDVAQALAEDLTDALAQKERVVLAVPGGTTPGPIFDVLSAADLDWERVDVILTDERWVPEHHERSNSALVKARLLTNRAMAARYLPLYAPAEVPEDVLPELEAGIAASLPVDVAVMGMGADMHTASLFPNAEGLEAALAADAPILIPVRRDDLPDIRITLSARVLNGALRKHILIKGADKRAALTAAQNLPEVDAPIRAVCAGADVHWTE
ncbi:6-phosphogluconolactonase [Shimia sp. MMG029]|uniref:6-phosphogluconolactonase n=1 Tax=Shimia sp. MMG029 TaxID=3021978 RepID=UPI0022FE0CAD|nr:6-phosphogluconolactonase [Shimia sp. MMG029]MDA5555696.1 6-phosphogluconolactonase [Shimia sp. MMG029]